jgi:rhomboid protease GluP
MTQRFYIYPLFFAVAIQLVLFLRTNARWYWAQVVQLLMILLASVGGVYFSQHFVWVIIAWSLFGVFVLVPRLLVRTAMRQQMTRPPNEVAHCWQLAGWFAWGNPSRVYQTYAAVSQFWGSDNRLAAEMLLEELGARAMPEVIRGEIRVWKLSLLVASRDFSAAVAYYERMGDCGSLASDTLARLLAARAYAETGETERALWSLQFAALSPQSIGPLEAQLWATRICVAALAGDEPELESLLRWREKPFNRRRGFTRFAAYWRGRCALVRGDHAEAVRQLARAHALTHPRNKLWRDAIAHDFQRAEAPPETINSPVGFAAQTPDYAAEQQALQLAEQQAARWRALMYMGQPQSGTLALLVVFTLVFLVNGIVFEGIVQQPLWVWAGNVPEAVRHGEWWRVTTALFLHANLLHLAMNGFALWLFGSAIEKSIGRWRFLAIFLVAGSWGNLLSAMMARYDVSVGASGGIFGVIAAFAVAVYHLESPMYAPMRRRLLMLIALMVAVDLTISGLEPQVDSLAHAGGFIAGLVLAAVLYPRGVCPPLRRSGNAAA